MSSMSALGMLLALAATGAAEEFDDGWSASLEDRSPGAWIAIGLYLLNAFLGFLRSGDGLPPGTYNPRPKQAWLAIAGVMLLMGLTRLFDLGNLATVVGRQIAVSEGFYEERQVLQVGVILVMAAAALGATLWLWGPGPRFTHRLRFAMAGTAFLIFFAGLRAISLHHFDFLLAQEWLGVRLSWIVEIGAAALVAGAAGAPSRHSTPG